MSLIKVDLKSVVKAAEILSDKVSEATGGLFRPWQIRRIAKAEADAYVAAAGASAKARVIDAEGQAAAALITDQSKIEREELQRRALARAAGEQERYQANIESIAEKAQGLVTDGAPVEQLDVDWVALLFQHGRLVSNEEMQRLWAQILAGQANKPGAFSRQTLAVVANLEKADAELFRRLASTRVGVTGERPVLPRQPAIIVPDTRDPLMIDVGLTFVNCQQLATLGLINLSTTGFVRSLEGPGYLHVDYHRESIALGFDGRQAIPLGQVGLTRAGEELLTLCEGHPLPGYIDLLDRFFTSRGLKVGQIIRTTSGESRRPIDI